MTDDLTLIERIQRNQTEIAADLDLLKQKESAKYNDDIETIKSHQSAVAAEVQALQTKIEQDKNGGAKESAG